MTRYTNFPLPQIAYVSGKTARPTEEPLVEFGIDPQPLSKLPLLENPFFLYGVDLYNSHYFWEAHESWELIWKIEPEPHLRSLMKGLIQASGGYVKIIQGVDHGARKLWHRSYQLLSRGIFSELGIDFAAFLEMVELDDGIETLTVEKRFVPLVLLGINRLESYCSGVK